MFACVRVRPFGACMCRQEPSMQPMLQCGSVPDAARPCARTADASWQVIDEAHRRMDALLARKLPLDLRAQRQPSAQQIRDPYTCLYGPFWCARPCAQRPAGFPPCAGASAPSVLAFVGGRGSSIDAPFSFFFFVFGGRSRKLRHTYPNLTNQSCQTLLHGP